MGEVKGSLLTIVAVIVTFGIVSAVIFAAFDNFGQSVATQVEAGVEYPPKQAVVVETEQTNLLAY